MPYKLRLYIVHGRSNTNISIGARYLPYVFRHMEPKEKWCIGVLGSVNHTLVISDRTPIVRRVPIYAIAISSSGSRVKSAHWSPEKYRPLSERWRLKKNQNACGRMLSGHLLVSCSQCHDSGRARQRVAKGWPIAAHIFGAASNVIHTAMSTLQPFYWHNFTCV